MNRRQFLKTAILTGIALFVPPTVQKVMESGRAEPLPKWEVLQIVNDPELKKIKSPIFVDYSEMEGRVAYDLLKGNGINPVMAVHDHLVYDEISEYTREYHEKLVEFFKGKHQRDPMRFALLYGGGTWKHS